MYAFVLERYCLVLEVKSKGSALEPMFENPAWKSSKLGVSENEKIGVEVHLFPLLKVEMWATPRLDSGP